MKRLHTLIVALLGGVLVMALLSPAALAGERKTWVSGDGQADFDGLCEGSDPDNGVFSNIFTSSKGPDKGLNGCWYFDFGSLDRAIGGDKVIDLPGPYYKVLWFPEERFEGTLDGEPVQFRTKGAVVVNMFKGDVSNGTEGQKVAGGCYHPLDERDGSGALVFIEELDSPNLTYKGRISVH